MHLIERQRAPILLGSAVAVAHIDDVVFHVLAHHIPRATAQAQSLALADGVEPIATVLAQLAPRFEFDYGARLLAQMATDKVIIIDLPQETDTLAITPMGVGQVGILDCS